MRFRASVAIVITTIFVLLPFVMYLPGIVAQIMTANWRPVEATILRSEIEREIGRRGRPLYVHVVTYEYELRGDTHYSHNIDFTGWFTQRYSPRMPRTRGRFPVGSTATAFVDPHDDSRAVLRRGVRVQDFFLLAPSLLFMIPAGAAWMIWLYYRRNGHDPT